MSDRTVITIGNFDGVHLGHRSILRRARAEADRLGAHVIAVTFHPHPAAVLRPGSEPLQLATIDERAALLRESGVDEVRVLAPSREVLSLTPDEFLQRMVDEFHPVVVIEGTDFRFGKNRAGDVAHLRRVQEVLGYTTMVVEPQLVGLCDQLQVVVSSSTIRWLLDQGRVMDAARCLGREFRITGMVVSGERRGRTIGVPTANLDLASLNKSVVPGDGVYAGWATASVGVRHAAAISIGNKPTFAGNRRAIEAHLLDFAGDLYGKPITLGFSRWLRDQRPFPGKDALVAQLSCDIAQTRAWREAGLLGDSASSALAHIRGAGEG